MGDLTVFAETLIKSVARAFYDDDCVILVDVLIAQKYLRDDDMAQRLSLPAKKLRASLQFLQEEHLVFSETVDDLNQGGSQATKFYYLDYNRAVHSIRLRLHLLRQKLQQAELRARSNSFYLCPGYKERRCNGRYTEEEAQQVVDSTAGLFLCQECSMNYENDPNPPPIQTYTLQLVDNTKDLRLAVDNLRRVNVQLSAKFIGNQQMRPGIYDLLQKVRGKGKKPITSNLPSENFALGIGSQRLAGTGRTAGIKAKKLEQQGVAESAAQAKKYLVGSRQSDDNDLLFLKNALGQEIQFTVERGGGARAQLLASKRRKTRKLMDAAASRVGATLPLYIQLEQTRKRKAEEAAKKEKEDSERNNKNKARDGRKLMRAGDTFFFLKDNIGRNAMNGDSQGGRRQVSVDVPTSNEQKEEDEPELVLCDDMEEFRNLPEETRMATFQNMYKAEMNRQTQLMGLDDPSLSSPSHTEEEVIPWEDGEVF